MFEDQKNKISGNIPDFALTLEPLIEAKQEAEFSPFKIDAKIDGGATIDVEADVGESVFKIEVGQPD